MRQILLDHAKARHRQKRGGKASPAPQTRIEDAASLEGPEKDESTVDLVALDAAIRRLEERDPRVAQVVYLKYYAGLEITQVALALGISERTVNNDWAFARAWLERTLRDDTSDQGK
jgi:RNA polymerase sigma factor (TIGR02999 family)